jgi:NADH dehydrogenase/NADH:ubiquinone oxidoreductase subunit G
MNQDKLDALYSLATDERTPEEERRSAAVLYLKHAPKNRIATLEELRASVTKDMFHSLFGPEIAEFQRKMTEQTTRADAATKRAEKAETDLRELKDAIRAARAAGEKVARLVDAPPSAEKPKTPQDQINDVFANGFYRGGFKW